MRKPKKATMKLSTNIDLFQKTRRTLMTPIIGGCKQKALNKKACRGKVNY